MFEQFYSINRNNIKWEQVPFYVLLKIESTAMFSFDIVSV